VGSDRFVWILAGVLGAFALLQTIRLWWLRGAAGRRLARARARGRAGEQAAIGLMERSGYAIEALQPVRRWTIHCDGQAQDIELRADLLVSRGDRRFVAEVKTGDAAPRLQTPATRRQLLEYSVAYDADGVLLIDVEAQRIHEIVFPRAIERARPGRSLLLAAMAFAATLIWLALHR
jgi:hypothetical protein